MKPIINVADGRTHGQKNGQRFEYQMTELASAIGAKQIGANVTRVPPGKAAFPFHHHYAFEEHFFIISGSGVLRVGDAQYPVRAQDYIVNPPGGPEHAHQLINTGNEPLVYLAISTQQLPEVVGYPDSGKTGVAVPSAGERMRFLITDADKNAVDYWDGEDGQRVDAIINAHEGS